MIESRVAARRGSSALAFPRIQSDVVVITTRADERCGVPHTLHQLKTQHTAIEFQRAIQVRNFQMDVTNADSRINRLRTLFRLFRLLAQQIQRAARSEPRDLFRVQRLI